MFEFILFVAVIVLIVLTGGTALSSGGGGYSARDNSPKVAPSGTSATVKLPKVAPTGNVRPSSDRTELGEPPHQGSGGRK
jgi:hypothetical protein